MSTVCASLASLDCELKKTLVTNENREVMSSTGTDIALMEPRVISADAVSRRVPAHWLWVRRCG